METFVENNININSVLVAFDKICSGLNPQRVSVMEKELQKMVPSAESEVLIKTGYSDNDNTLSINLFVNKVLSVDKLDVTDLNKILRKMILKADISELSNVKLCIDMMERKKGDVYVIDGIPAFYDDESDDFYIHITITK